MPAKVNGINNATFSWWHWCTPLCMFSIALIVAMAQSQQAFATRYEYEYKVDAQVRFLLNLRIR